MIRQKIKIIFLFLKSINSYGIITSTKIIYFEIVSLILLKDIKSLSFNDDKTSSYLASKKSSKYNVPYIPTPYYFLYLIKEYLFSLNINKINLIDIGCGYCRPAKYLSKKIFVRFSGMEINKDIADEIIKEKNKRFKIYNFNLRNAKKTKNFFKNSFVNNLNNVLLISDTVEINLINNVLNKINYETKVTLVLINIKYRALRIKKFKIKKKILFKNKSRNIIFLDNIIN